MALGMQGSFNILRQSPHDLRAGSAEETPSAGHSDLIRWKPSRYNIRATGEDGGFILWNTLSNAISVFRGEQIPLVEKALRGVEARKKGTIKYLVDRGVPDPRGNRRVPAVPGPLRGAAPPDQRSSS